MKLIHQPLEIELKEKDCLRLSWRIEHIHKDSKVVTLRLLDDKHENQPICISIPIEYIPILKFEE